MSDLSRFNKMTKPLKFRRLKIIQRYLKSLATRTITSVINGYYNILYKLHISDQNYFILVYNQCSKKVINNDRQY